MQILPQIKVDCTIVETKEKTTVVYTNIMEAMQGVIDNGYLATMTFGESIVPKILNNDMSSPTLDINLIYERGHRVYAKIKLTKLQ